MAEETQNKLYEIIDQIPITDENKEQVEEIKHAVKVKNYKRALQKIEELNNERNEKAEEREREKQEEENLNQQELVFPKELSDEQLEYTYMGLLLENPKSISRYYFLFKQCYFEDEKILNVYKSVLFTEGAAYAPEIAKEGFNFSKDSEEVYKFKDKLKRNVKNKNYDSEDIYIELKKLFVLRKAYVTNPVKSIQDKIVEIRKYKLYKEMSVEEVESAVNQVTVTNKFKQTILNRNLTSFLEEGSNNLVNGLSLPFPILTQIFKGIRKGETMAYAMPSNSGKSRFAIDLAAYTAFVNKKKVLLISNEMSEEKMKLCLITTILNDPNIQKIHGQDLHITENEILALQFKADDPKNVKVDEQGHILKEKDEKQKDFIKRLQKQSTEFNKVITVTDWINKEINNSIYFMNITDHTNDELKKVIMNYYYKEKIEYVFYDTLKTDTANIGNSEEIKKTATILSNIAQNFEIFICSSLQLAEAATLPINLDVNDLAVSRTVKEVLDTLCLIKQINQDHLQDYEYSLQEVDTTFYDLEKYDDPDVRYYACVVDKNRAGPKPKLVFRLNLAYNRWEELGYLRLKQTDNK